MYRCYNVTHDNVIRPELYMQPMRPLLYMQPMSNHIVLHNIISLVYNIISVLVVYTRVNIGLICHNPYYANVVYTRRAAIVVDTTQ